MERKVRATSSTTVSGDELIMVNPNLKPIGKYTIDTSKMIGKGHFGAVYVAYYGLKKFKVACKMIKINSMNEQTKTKELRKFDNEVQILG